MIHEIHVMFTYFQREEHVYCPFYFLDGLHTRIFNFPKSPKRMWETDFLIGLIKKVLLLLLVGAQPEVARRGGHGLAPDQGVSAK